MILAHPHIKHICCSTSSPLGLMSFPSHCHGEQVPEGFYLTAYRFLASCPRASWLPESPGEPAWHSCVFNPEVQGRQLCVSVGGSQRRNANSLEMYFIKLLKRSCELEHPDTMVGSAYILILAFPLPLFFPVILHSCSLRPHSLINTHT